MKWFCRHDWTCWSLLIETNKLVHQYRTCKKCGLIRKNFRGWWYEFNLDRFNGIHLNQKEKAE